VNRATFRKAVADNRMIQRTLMPGFRASAARRIRRSGIFSTPWYSAQTGRSFASEADAVRDFVERGRRLGYSPHPLVWPSLISPAGWERVWPEPTLRVLHPLTADIGSPLFDAAAWVRQSPAAAKHGYGPFAHFLSVAGPDTPVPTRDGRRLLLGEVLDRSIDAARQRLAERDLQLHGRRGTWDPAPQRQVVEQVAAWAPGPDGEPLVSVVMPVRNRPEQVAVAIASVRAQTYASWELVVVDDGSTDSTADVVRALAAEDDRVRLVQEERRGVSGARNRGLDESRGGLVAFLDSDNTWDRDFLRVMVARMGQTGSRFAHSAVRGSRDGEVWYRSEDGGLEELLHGNFIDLNAVVVTRDLLDAVGHFDERIRRMVDWDLVIRLARAEPPLHVRYLGVLYDDTHEGHDRVTTTELRSWREVILSKHQIDWSALSTRDRVAGMVSVVIPTFQDWEMTVTAVDAVLATSGDRPVEVIVVDNGSRLMVWAMLSVLLVGRPGVRVVRRPSNDHFALGSDVGFAEVSGEFVLFLNNDTEAQPGWIEPLVAALDEPGVAGAQPLLQYPDGTIQCAGVVFPGAPGSPGLPSHLLVGHPPEDAARLGRIATHAVTAAALLMRSATVAGLRGFDPIYTNGFEDVDLCLRAGGEAERCFRVVTDSRVIHHESRTPGRRKRLAANRRFFLDRWHGRIPVEHGELWAAAGFEVAHYDVEASSTEPTTPRIARPVVVRHRDAAPDSLRWALKVPVPLARISGDAPTVGLAHELARALERLGQQACVDPTEAHDRSTSCLDDVLVTVRGALDVAVQPGRVNLLWVVDGGAHVTEEESRRYDAVLAADPAWAARATASFGVDVAVLPLPAPGPDGPSVEVVARGLLERALALRAAAASR
jgi:GT2 family glycosyltransferase